jgi:RimJ/RimL family protein N-acetyltransferase
MDGPYSDDDAWLDFCMNCANRMLRGHGMWTVTEKTGAVLGFVLIGFEPGDQEPELGYMFVDAAEGRGYATEAVTAARDLGLTRLQLSSLVSYIAPENTRSRAVARRLGAFPDGCIDGCEIWRHAPKGPR